jgi:REP element-mobilizing transposase RayT
MHMNQKYQKIGHIFQGRFNAIYLRYKKDLVQAINYIRNNPVEEGWVRKPADYRWNKRE